ncbi:MAG: hypothetical protein DRQ49_02730 [Gammaproteobacteria bacterium]|nr:MAG: hypothetical protein DRQ49_02730 [Gammaproteobacteria bacterium]RKZ43648.1 MAG: hypothetical protein DRQ41_04770 [Gammaproteobacteria bacterium]
MLPLKKVVLFKHGVGYFEREGQVKGDASIDLHFRASEMNDVLKSLTVLDLNDGLITSISYESTLSLEEQLKDIAIRLPEKNALRGLLSQISGAHVAVEVGQKTITGIVTGIETIKRQVGDATLDSPYLSLLIEGGALQSFDIMETKQITLLDDNLKKDLQHLLDVLIATKRKDQKKLTVFLKGEGERTINLSYVIAAPLWKTSYRLLLQEKLSLIQGWALVDNTQDEDWENVDLSLVAGLPVSFIYDLYSPRHQKRPVVRVKEEAAYASPESEKTVVDYESLEIDGDLFQYEIENPVTVRRQQSALVPILQTHLSGQPVAVYNQEVRYSNPMSALLFKNSTELTLENGPVTLFEEDAYVGEAMLNTLKPDEEQLVSYSVELGCIISIDSDNETQAVHQVHITQGFLELYYYELDSKTYFINNNTERKLDLFLEHRFNPGWELTNTPQPVERIEHFYRFRFDVPRHKTKLFTVTECIERSSTYIIKETSRETLSVWLRKKYIDKKTLRTLEGIVQLTEQLTQIKLDIETKENAVMAIFKNQDRVRQNLQAFGNTEAERGLRERYIDKLANEEDKLAQYQTDIDALKTQKGATEKTLNTQINSIEFKAKL